MQKIRFTLGTDGSIKTDAEGFVGGECLKATSQILASLTTAAPTEIIYKDSFYTESVAEHEVQTQG